MDTGLVDIVIKVISTVGFPIFVAIWLLWRDYKIMSTLVNELGNIHDALERLIQK